MSLLTVALKRPGHFGELGGLEGFESLSGGLDSKTMGQINGPVKGRIHGLRRRRKSG